jgi:hypothetical protein
MSILLNCDGCGTRLQVGDDLGGRPVQCPRCGRVFAAPEPIPTESPQEPLGVYGLKDEPEFPSVLAAEDSARPRAAPGVPSEHTCPKCGAALKPEAVVCVDCGFNRKTGKQLRTVSRRLEARWYKDGLSYLARLLLLGFLLLLCGGLYAALLAAEESPAVALVLPIIWGLAGALLLGIMERGSVTRTAEGKAVLVRRWWVGFIPIGRTTLDLEPYTIIRPRTEPAPLDAQMLLMMFLLCFFCGVPGLVYLLIRITVASPSRFVLEIGGALDDFGADQVPRRVVFRGSSESAMRRCGDALEQIAGMRYG